MESIQELITLIKDLLMIIPEVLSGPVVLLIIVLVFRESIINLLKSISDKLKILQAEHSTQNPCQPQQAPKAQQEINPQMHQSMAQAFALRGSYDEAIAQYKAAINLDPENASAYIGLGNAFHKIGLYQEAIKALEKAVEIKPYWADARCNLGAAYSLASMHEKSVDEFLQAININPNYAAAHYGLGIAYISANMLDKATDQVNALKELEPIFSEKLAKTIEEARNRS